MATFIALLIPVTIQHNAYEINPSHFGRENYLNASLFVLLFVLLLFFRFSLCFFFWGGAQGVGVGFVF